jgi:class 3 adenylate cyclase
MSNANTEQRKLAAIRFTDMVGYSALAQRDETLALELLEEQRRIVRGLLARHGGREVKTTGDGFLLEFPSALAAVQGAVEIQHACHERNQSAPSERRLRLRIGIHVGDVVLSGGDIHGDGASIAARIEPLAEPGGICVSEDVARQIRNKLPHRLVTLGPGELKHIGLPVVICRILLPWEEQTTTNFIRKGPAPSRRTARTIALALIVVLLLGGAGWWLWPERYDREMKDVFDIQDDITRAIVGALEVQLGGGSETQFVRRQTTSTEAYELYVKGRILWNQCGVGLKKALHHFELALLEDPVCAPAWSGLADAYALLGLYDQLPGRDAINKARLAAQKAVALDD